MIILLDRRISDIGSVLTADVYTGTAAVAFFTSEYAVLHDKDGYGAFVYFRTVDYELGRRRSIYYSEDWNLCQNCHVTDTDRWDFVYTSANLELDVYQ